MFADKITNPIRITPPPRPEPKPEPKSENLTQNAVAKIADQKSLGLQIRHKIERAVGDIFTTTPIQPNPGEILKLAQDNAPVLVLPKSHSVFERIFEGWAKPNVSQGNLPADPLEYIANSRLREDIPFGLEAPDLNPFNGGFDPTPIKARDEEIANNTDGDTGNNFGPEKLAGFTDGKTFLDLSNDKRGTLGSSDAPIHYQFEPAKDGAPPKLTYHFFYDYNDAPKGEQIPIDFNHEGDWERITYELDAQTFKPVNAVLSAHDGNSTFDIKDLQTDAASGRPLIFVANGSHANYATPGDHSITKKILGKEIEISYDQTSDTDDAVLFDTSRNLREVTSQSWYPASGSGLHWGEIGESEHSTGPQGPSENKGSL